MTSSFKSLFSASKSVRMFLFNSSLFILAGIWLTGFDKVHWFIYFVPGFYLFAALTGLCPGLAIARLIFGKE